MRSSISVVILTHNRPTQLERCINSVLSNKIFPKEIVVVDDSDNDKKCRKLINSLREKTSVPIVYHSTLVRKGVSFARNIGIKTARGKIIAFIDDDCTADSKWLSAIAKSHAQHPESIGICGQVLPAFPKNYWNQILYLFHSHKEEKVQETDFIYVGNSSFKLEKLKKNKIEFNENMHFFSEDTYISHLLRQQGNIFFYDPAIKVTHDFREKAQEVFKQWFTYGVGDYYLWKMVPDFQSENANFFRSKNLIVKLLKVPFRLPREFFNFISWVNGWNHLRLLPGLILICFAYQLGIHTTFFKESFK